MQLTIPLKEGSTPTDIANTLRFHANLFEGMDPKAAASRKNTAAPETGGEDFEAPTTTTKTSKKAAAKAAPADDESADFSEETTTSDEDDFMAAAAPETKAATKKKYTANDVNDACKAKAQASDRATVLGILKKKFKVSSVTELKPDQYADVITAMKV
jgi:hypothetical protein